MAAIGLGTALLPRIHLGPAVPDLSVVPIADCPLVLETAIAARAEAAADPAVHAFLDFARAAATASTPAFAGR